MPTRPVRAALSTMLAAVAGTAVLLLLLHPGASRGATDPDPHLVVVPATDAGRAALAATAPRKVASYDAFTLVEATGKDVDRLQAGGGDVRDDMKAVQTEDGRVDPAKDRPQLGSSKTTAGPEDDGLALVQ